LVTFATAPRRLIAALAAVLLVAPATATIGRAADIAPGGGGVIAADAPVLIRTAPGYDAPTAGEAAPGTWVTVVGGPEYDAEGNAWYPTDAGGYVPAWAVGEGAVAAQEAAPQPAYEDPALAAAPADAGYDAAAQPVSAEPVYEDPAAQPVYDDAVYEEPVYEDPAAQPVYEETAAEPVYAEPAPAPAPEAPAYDPNNVVATAWIAGTNGDGAVCRAGMGFDTAEVGWLAEGEAVPVIGDTVGEWQPVACGGMAAFVHASFVAWQQPTTVESNAAGADGVADDAAVDATFAASEEQRGRRGKDRGNDGGNDGGGATSSGQAMVDVAMRYLGSPYAYAGEGPHAFDCSGFTMFVAREALGIDITHDMFTQVGMGRSVSRGELQPGDLVFFQNTFRDGLSHAGIYIGNGQFIHAENESTGVVISDLNSDYYGSRWYGATRLA
jgi:cell wall-associated NlpC family hydrolase